MSIDAQLSSDAAEFLQDFEEPITFIPQTGSPSSINAVVFRDRYIKADGSGGKPVAANRIEVMMANSSTLGVTAIKERFDKLTVKLKLTDAAVTTFVITKILNHDPGFFHVEAQA